MLSAVHTWTPNLGAPELGWAPSPVGHHCQDEESDDDSDENHAGVNTLWLFHVLSSVK